ncbi:oxygen-regulated protein 1 [Periophthalmus magnuspinnatus]|uniref:oxygen-regulated protein 1 n=1 Tax=Periophthalmus magnuspinnatus TaxID=409849 RepID=UPI0024365A22|nr:oxygen-regulated protein 1 [Periophthalmus magnuspinnatus]
MNEQELRRTLPEQFSGSGHTFGTQRHQSVTNPILSKRVCFYKSGDPQFNGLRMVINSRTFKTFDALLDSLSKKVPLPFGVRNITTPRGVHAVSSLDELEDGKSYICSDHRKVKPINLAMAQKKPPPWYHARPVSSRRRTIQKAQRYPGHKLHNLESVVMRTPKKLLVFRNGDPAFKCVVVLQKKSTPTFESILRYISELMQFNVAKLHTPEGRHVDGLPGLIMCSGTVVAAGREKFKPANYNSQKSFEPPRMRVNRRSVRRLKALSQSAYSMPTNSIEMESIHILDSVAESEAENFAGAGVEGQDCLLPTDDDIEKSFRVNQDGSMTVEMKVRLTIKEEETLHWTTTLSRSSVSDQLTGDSFLAPAPEQEISLPESDHMDLRTPAATPKDINKNKDICKITPKLDVERFDANDVSCAEALEMMESLREIASIDERQTLQSVSEHETCSEKKIANGLRKGIMSPSQRELSPLSDRNASSTESPMSQLSPGTRSAPQSSLSFSYDSTSVITKQPEGNRDIPEGTKMQSEKNGKLPGGVTDFKIMDNKVHPLVEVSPAHEAVVVQPVRGQGVMSRRVQEPDVLDILYNFCGEHCPIL